MVWARCKPSAPQSHDEAPDHLTNDLTQMKLNSISQGYHISADVWHPSHFRVFLNSPILSGFNDPTFGIGFEIDSINAFGDFVRAGEELT